jgi:hypothetical protein
LSLVEDEQLSVRLNSCCLLSATLPLPFLLLLSSLLTPLTTNATAAAAAALISPLLLPGLRSALLA